MATAKKKTAEKATAKKATVKKAPAKKAPTKKAPAKKASLPSAPVQQVLERLDEAYREPTTALTHRTPLQLLIATILSAQCTDLRVNQVTPGLFAAFPSAAALAGAPLEELEELIRSTGFFHNKARSIQGSCRVLVERHGGEVPGSMEALLELPGVARKTANVVLGTAFGVASGVVVDTHVRRLSGRLGWSAEDDPVKIEQDLMTLLPTERWIGTSHQLILHGRAICQARKPRCGDCPLADLCPSAALEGA